VWLRAQFGGLSSGARYARYCAHEREQHGRAPRLTPEEFFRAELRRRWDGIQRCC
jgi:uncharacterized short protein YbdD (DUF466 family)